MSKKEKIILGLIFVTILLIVYLVATSRLVNSPATPTPTAPVRQQLASSPPQDKAQKEYQRSVRVIVQGLGEVWEEINSATSTPPANWRELQDRLNQLKGQLLEIRTPAFYQKLQGNILQSILKANNFLQTQDLSSRDSGLELWQDIINGYAWLR